MRFPRTLTPDPSLLWRLFALVGLLLGAASPALALDDEPVEEIVVWGDLFARWDDTRWMITTEVALPYALTLARDQDQEFQTREFVLKTVLNCNKDWKLGRRRYEVSCRIEDFAIRAAISERRISDADIARAQAVLDEIDAKLSGADLQLQVADDGRVTNLDLEGLPQGNRRQSEIHETLRQVLSRVIVGFNLKLRKFNQLNEGKWYEYNSTLLSMPAGNSMRNQGADQGSNMVVHYLNPFEGQTVVQSIGKGVVSMAGGVVPNTGGELARINYTLDLIGVSIFDKSEGFMLERVWAIHGNTTASAGFTVQPYFNAGRIWMLGKDERPDCGTSRVVDGRNQSNPELPDWEPIEAPIER